MSIWLWKEDLIFGSLQSLISIYEIVSYFPMDLAQLLMLFLLSVFRVTTGIFSSFYTFFSSLFRQWHLSRSSMISHLSQENPYFISIGIRQKNGRGGCRLVLQNMKYFICGSAYMTILCKDFFFPNTFLWIGPSHLNIFNPVLGTNMYDFLDSVVFSFLFLIYR